MTENIQPVNKQDPQADKENLVTIETKTQTIYYENTAGQIKKYYHAETDRINNTDAFKLLEKEGLSPAIVLKVLRERIDIQMTRKEFQEKITNSERFYKQRL